MKYLKSIICLALLGLFTQASVGGANITMKGSDTLVILAQKWAEHYMREHPDVKIQVNGGGSGTGFAALQNQTTDLANASRKIKPKEVAACVKAFGKRPVEYKVALDGLSIYVNEANSIEEITLDQLKAIFTGEIQNWSQLGGVDKPITLYSRENSSGTYEFFKENVLDGRDFHASAQAMPGTAALLQAVARDPKGIGYGGAAYGEGAKALKVKKTASSPAIPPTEEAIMSGEYPIWRHLYIYVNPNLKKGAVADFLTWIRSDEGQGLVKDVGYFPLPEELREKQ